MASHSTRVRGLKWENVTEPTNTNRVALYTSAWIEISNASNGLALIGTSHSTRVRGLK